MPESRESPEWRLPPQYSSERPDDEVIRATNNDRSERPTLIAAFEGWNDAGEAASFAADHLAKAWDTDPIAEISDEAFFDFTEARPEITIVGGRSRKVSWPRTTFAASEGSPPVVIVNGPEPQLRWRSYSREFVDLVEQLRVGRVILLGAYLADVTHRGAVHVSATTADPDLMSDEAIAPSYYEGPTGIVGVLGTELADAGIPVISVWATVPCYSVSVSAKAALALAETAARLADRTADLGRLARQAVDHEQLLEDLVANDENLAAWIERIESGERDLGSESVPTEGLTDEIERFLRDSRGT